ncbi:uncharacterized protein LOC133516060 [Cydia pomonella]|uniref:uncharacterized protein LOC133516060 n=1 Tax=Cydia pomonella TaxID=82600 RepID=UPI002ADDE392|nr:uncharacterized protein LOC133516060 [Cydia pomonella]
MNKLSALISRKEQLLKQREALQRRQQIDFKDGSNSDIVEESDTEMFPKISTSSIRSQHNVTNLSSEYHDSNMNEINNHKITNDLITNLPNNHQLQLPIIHEESAKNHTNDPTSCTINNVKFYTENTTQGTKKNKINIISDVVIKLPNKGVLGNDPHNLADSESVTMTELKTVEAALKVSSKKTTTEDPFTKINNDISEADMDAPRHFTDLDSDTEKLGYLNPDL